MDIQSLADEAYKVFTLGTRPNGDTFWMLKDDGPEWVTDLLCATHENGHIPPDDWRYEFTLQTLTSLSEGADPLEPDLEADVYMSDLTRWLASSVDRPTYVNDVIDDVGSDWKGVGISDLLQAGQLREKEEVWQATVDFLSDLEGDMALYDEQGGRLN